MNTSTSIVISDLHVPNQAQPVVKLVLDFIRSEKPDRVHILGDACDFVQISRFDKDPTRKETLQDELDGVRDLLTEIRDAAPKAKIIYSEGNHEFRLRRYLMSEAKGLAGLRALTLEKLLDFKTLRIKFQPQDRPYRIGHLLFTHGQFVSKWSAYSAKRHFERYGCCVIHGHTHRLGAYYHTDLSDTFAAFENGCLSTLTPDYVTAPDWQNGFSVVSHCKGFFSVEQIAVIHQQFCFRGRVFGKMKTNPSNMVEDLS